MVYWKGWGLSPQDYAACFEEALPYILLKLSPQASTKYNLFIQWIAQIFSMLDMNTFWGWFL